MHATMHNLPGLDMLARVASLELAARRVNEQLGGGFSEAVYQGALEVELRQMGVSYETQVVQPVTYAGFQVGHHRPDLVVDGCMVVELKARPGHDGMRQLQRYLSVGSWPSGALVVFRDESPLVMVASALNTASA